MTEIQATLDAALEYVRSNDGNVSKVDVLCNNANEGFGLFASESITKGEVLMTIPFNLCISVKSVAESAIGEIFTDNPSLLKYQDEVLAIALMYSKTNPGTQWGPHVATLPDAFNTTIYWTDEQLEELKPSPVFQLSKMMVKQIENDWQQIHEPLKQNYPALLGGTSLAHYKWAMSIVYSRAIGVTRRAEYIRVVAPVMDMANHSPDVGTTASDSFVYDDASDAMTLTSAGDMELGAEVFVCYGSYPNAKLAHTYGFVLPTSNPTQCLDFWTRCPPSVVAAEHKNSLLMGNKLTAYQGYDFVGTLRDDWISPALLTTVRVIQATQDELPQLPRAFNGAMVSVRNEAACYGSLKQLLIARMRPERVEEDRRELAALLLELEAAQPDASVDSVFDGLVAGAGADATARYRRLMALTVRSDEAALLVTVCGLLDQWTAALQAAMEGYRPPDADPEYRRRFALP